jgi:hypothetical protein
MQPHDTLFTPTEAAVLTGLSLKAVNNAIDKKTVDAAAGDDAGRPTRLLDARSSLCPLNGASPIASRPSCGARCSTPWRDRRATSSLSRAGCSRSICVNPGGSWQRRYVIYAAPAIWS